MAQSHQYEKLGRRSSEDAEAAPDDQIQDDDVEKFSIREGLPSRIQSITKYLHDHKSVLGAGTACLIAAIVLTILATRIFARTAKDDGKIMNLLVLEGDPTLHYPNPPQPDGMLTNFTTFCGSTARMAQSRGCVFDVMSFAWLPAHCVDIQMMERYISERTWEWYADYDMTQQMSVDVVRQGEYKWMFSNQSYHIAHCVYTWERQKRFLFAQKREDAPWIDQGSFVAHHTTHCIDYICK